MKNPQFSFCYQSLCTDTFITQYLHRNSWSGLLSTCLSVGILCCDKDDSSEKSRHDLASWTITDLRNECDVYYCMQEIELSGTLLIQTVVGQQDRAVVEGKFVIKFVISKATKIYATNNVSWQTHRSNNFESITVWWICRHLWFDIR